MKWFYHAFCGNQDVAPFAGAWIEMSIRINGSDWNHVAPFAGAWIEIPGQGLRPRHRRVAPFAGAWIEIGQALDDETRELSLPSRERGLKLDHLADWMDKIQVAPFAGAWIEIIRFVSLPALDPVAPFAGAWIEMSVEEEKALEEVRRSLRGSVD